MVILKKEVRSVVNYLFLRIYTPVSLSTDFHENLERNPIASRYSRIILNIIVFYTIKDTTEHF